MSNEHFQTFLTCDMRTAPDQKSGEYAERGKGVGPRSSEGHGWFEGYLYVHNVMELCARTVEESAMSGLTGDHPERRAYAANLIRAVADLVKDMAADAAHDGSLTQERWTRATDAVAEAVGEPCPTP